MLFILGTIMGLTWGTIIYIYLFLCNSHVQRDQWIYITNNWSSLLLCSVWSFAHSALPVLSQCHLHFPRIHYQAAAVCFAFIPQVAPHMKITHHIPLENSSPLNSTLLTISCTLTSWLPLCFVWNRCILGQKYRKSQLPHKWTPSLLRWSGSPPTPAPTHVPSLFLPCAFQLLGERNRVCAIGSPFWLFIHGFSI